MYITINTIERATVADDGSIEVGCVVKAIAGNYLVNVNITGNTVCVARVIAYGDAPPVDLARILVSTDLINATRRLFGLVGEA